MNTATSKFLSLPPSLPWLYNDQLDTFTAGDVDGDGRQEIVVSNCPGTLNYTADTLGTAPALRLLSYFTYGDLEPSWTIDHRKQMLTMWTAQGVVPGIQHDTNWLLDFTNRFYVADVDGDGIDEVVAFSAENCSLGLFKWDGAGLRSLFAPFGVYDDNFVNVYQIFGADVDGDGAAEVIVFMPVSTTFNVYKWNGSGLDNIFTGQALGGIALLNSDQFFFPTLQGSSGDKKQQVFLYRDTNPSCNVFEWTGSDFHSIFSQPSINGFSFAADDQFFAGDVDGNGSDELLVYSPSIQKQRLSLLSWNGAGFDQLWYAQGTIVDGSLQFGLDGTTKIFFCANGGGGERLLLFNPDLGVPTPNGDELCSLVWQSSENQFSFSAFDFSVLGGRGTSPENHFLCADVDGDGGQEFIFYHAADSSIPSPSSLTVLKQIFQEFVEEWSASNCTPAWNLSIIVAAPKTSFTPFDGSQLAVYRYVSNQLDPGDDNIRSTYTNANDKYSFGGWASTVEDNLLRTPPNNFGVADWRDVNERLYIELNAVDKVYGLTSSRKAIATAVKSRQLEELKIAQHNVRPAPASDANIDYWPEQIVVAAIWGIAAFPYGEDLFVINMAMSIVASLLGSLLSEPQSTPSVSSYYKLSSDIEKLYDKFITVGAEDEVKVLKDALKLPMVGTLADRAWKIEPTDPETIARHASKANRLYFYENLIPLSFNFMVWAGVETAVPAIWIGFKGGGAWEGIGAPDCAYLSELVGDGTYNIYLLYNGGGIFSWEDFQYPKPELMNDLFDTNALNVPKDIFFNGEGVWSGIACSSFAGGSCDSSVAEGFASKVEGTAISQRTAS